GVAALLGCGYGPVLHGLPLRRGMRRGWPCKVRLVGGQRMTVRYASRIPSWRLRRWLPTALAAYLGGFAFAGTAAAQPPAAPPGPMTPLVKPTVPPALEAPKVDAVPEKTVSFIFDGKPWGSVLDWFAKESGLVFYSTSGGMPQ